MTLQQLQYFLAAADHRSFSAAAQALHMAQPSLSDQIRRLEAELGSPLFVRARRGLALTEAGRLLLPQAERTLAAAQEAADSVREVRELAAGTATFGTFGNAPYYLLSDLVQDFRTRSPNVRVRLIGQNSSEVADAVRDGHLEAGLIVLPIDDRGLDDTIAASRIAMGRGFARRLQSVSFDPPLVDTFAFVTRRNAHVSPATRA